MDTGTHLVVGLGLAGLAYIDPAVAADSTLATAVLLGTVIGSQAPDFDTLLRLKSNAAYVKNHRGLSHSIPAVLIWTGLITAILAMIFNPVSWLHLGGWVFLAVSLHVFSDCFNSYGTQAARPFSDKWIAWNIIHIFDPFIFISHIIAIFLWSINAADPAILFPILYSVVTLYYIWRTVVYLKLRKNLPQLDARFEPGDAYVVIPTINLYVWNIVKEQQDGSYWTGELRHNKLQWVDRVKSAVHPAVEESKSHPNIDAFIYLSSLACAEMRNHRWGYEVRWFDVRYRHRKQYPFVAVVTMDRQLQPINSYVGWLSEEKVEKHLQLDTY